MAYLPSSYLQARRNYLNLDEIDSWTTDKTTSLFVYGSLMAPGVAIRRMLETSTDKDEKDLVHRMTPALITHHKRLAVKSSPFCALVDQGTAQDTVEGILIFGITAKELGRLDRYEAGMFSREEVCVQISVLDKSTETTLTIQDRAAETYLWARCADELVPPAQAEWTLQHFVFTPDYRALVDNADEALELDPDPPSKKPEPF